MILNLDYEYIVVNVISLFHRIHYRSGTGDVKIFAPEDRNPTNSKKDAYMKFESKNFEDWTEDEESDHFDDTQESQREFKTFFRTGDKEGLVAEAV